MRIAIWLENYLAKSETFVLRQVEYLAGLHDVTVLCREITRETELGHVFRHVPKWPWQSLNQRFYYWPQLSWRFRSEIRQFFKVSEVSLLHCHFGIQALVLLDNYIPKHIPVFITFHGYDISRILTKSWLYRQRLRNLLKHDNVHPIFVCKFHQLQAEKFGIRSSQAKVLYNGTDTLFFRRTLRSSPKDSTQFVQVSRFVGKKGHRYTIQAFARFKAKNPTAKFRLMLIGDGPLRRDAEHLVQSLGLSEHVQFLGWCDQLEIREQLDQSHIYVQHSVTDESGDQEATSVTILEAMAMELPILTSDHAGIPELFEDRNADATLVQEKDIAGFVQGIEGMMGRGYSQVNRQIVIDNFNIEKRNSRLEEFYRTAISGATD